MPPAWRLRLEMADDTIKFGDTVRRRGPGHHDTLMVLDVRPREKKGDWAGWYKVMVITASGPLAHNSIGQVAFVRQAEVTKVK